MRVAMWYSNRDVRVEEMPVPQIGPGDFRYGKTLADIPLTGGGHE